MAVQEAASPAAAASSENASGAWAGVVVKAIFAGIAILFVAVIALVVNNNKREAAALEDRKAWDEVYNALKDVKDLPGRIAALEGVWDKVSASSAHSNVMLSLAQSHYAHATMEERPLADRKKSFERARQVFALLLEREGRHPLYGAMAAEGNATCLEQEGKLDDTIKLLGEAVTRYDKHFLHSKLCYQLGRAYWLRALKSKDSKDNDEALRWVDKAVQQSQDKLSKDAPWRLEALYIKSLLEKHGPAWPGATPPPVRSKVEAKTAGEAKTDAKTEAKTETKP